MQAKDEFPAAANRSRARRLAGLATGALILAFLLWGLLRGWGEVSNYEWHLQPSLLVAAALVVYAGFATSCLGYMAIVKTLGIEPAVSRLAVASGWAKSLLGRYVPGTVVMLASRVVLGREAGVPARITLAASVYEQVLLLTTAAIAAIAFVVAYESSGATWALLAIAVVVGLTLIHPRVFRKLSSWALRKIGREPLTRFIDGPQLLWLLLLYALVNLLMGAGVWLFVRSAAGSEAGGPLHVGLAFLLSFALGMLAWIVPSGIGVRDGAFALALSRNIASGVAIAVATGVRIALTVVELLFIATVLALPRLLARRGARSGVATVPER